MAAAASRAPIGDPGVPPMLRVRNLETHLLVDGRSLAAVDRISFDLSAGETLGVVGESGCGKSMMALSLLRLHPDPPARIVGGSAVFDGRDLLTLPRAAIRDIRGDAISMIFQEPMTSLNPVMTIGRQIAESLVRHRGMGRRAAMARAVEMLELVQLPDPARRVRDYPHSLSGGMRQRAMIAMAMATDPRIVIADEPTTALDVTIQAQILDLIHALQQRTGAAVLLITHDLGVIAEMADRVIVMYAGRKVEEAAVVDLFDRPLHPYTRGLLASVPRVPRAGDGAPGDDPPGAKPLSEIPGTVPPLWGLPSGCAFAPRCALATERCRRETPPLERKRAGHWAACWAAEPGTDNGRAD